MADGGSAGISAAVCSDATIRAPRSSWFPKQWSPFACVLTSVSMRAAAGTARRIALSMSSVRWRSNSVSTSNVASPSTTIPLIVAQAEGGISDSVLRAGVHLFAPERAIRVRRSVSNDTPLPPEEPHGENPSAGAVVDYVLQAAPSGPVTLEILDAGGRLVRRFSSEDRPRPPAEPPQIAAEWLPRDEALPRHAGLNRFVWDLRYPPPPAERHGYSIAAIAGHGTVAEPEGPLILPGEYRLRLTAAGRTLTQPLRVENDPRVHVADSALANQLRLALEIWNAMAEQYALRAAVRGVRDQLRPTAAPSLDTIAQDAGDGALAGLETVVESADRQPTQQARDVFDGARARLARAQRRWQEFVTKDLPALNAQRARQHLSPVTAPALRPDAIALP